MAWRSRNARSTYQQSIWHAARPEPVISPEHKVILLGTAGVGKTSFFLRVRDQAFVQPESTCRPADYLEKRVKVSSSPSGDVSLTILLYDTAGGEKFRTLTSNFFQNAHAAVLMFSVDDVLSFHKMEMEVDNARPFLDRDFLWVVVGNKSDLERDPEISEDRLEAFCATLGTTLWIYTSAKTGENVEQVLETVARQLYRVRYGSGRVHEEYRETVQLISVDDSEPVRRKKGCKNQHCDTT